MNFNKKELISCINFIKEDNNKDNFIEEIYGINILNDKEKFLNKKDLIESFKKKFFDLYDSQISFISRAPGRVNIIGEHIDYEGFSVLPMAIEKDILIACSIEHSNLSLIEEKVIIEINHLNSEKYPKYILESITISEENCFNLDFIKPHSWVNYIIAGINAIKCGLKISYNEINSRKIKKINLLVTGNIPSAAGLSSSSALTVASALTALNFLNLREKFTKFEIANATIDYERSVGTAGGGMDQTISICAEKGNAKLIEFTPKLNTKNAKLPNNVSFIILNSMTESTKVDTLAFRFNKRVVENKFALAIIAKNLKLNFTPKTLIELKNNYPKENNDNNEINFRELNSLIENNLKDGNYSLEEIYNLLGNEEDIKKLLINIPLYEDVLEKNKDKDFCLKNRLLHVCSESERVENFFNLCNEDRDFTKEELLKLGNLMNESHQSCRDLYECSSKELDEIVKFASEKGALGARLTGAGWGGCAVIMVENDNVKFILNEFKSYYSEKCNVKFTGNSFDKCDEYFFCTKPSKGACILI